jgi:hypothetical protein
MAVVFDASILIDLFNPRLVGERKSKLDCLAKTLLREKTKILVPTPALTELMIKADKARDDYLRKLSSTATFKIEPFGERAAMECAMLLAEAFPAKQRRQISRGKLKFDWQIIAIAASCKAKAIYSDDEDIARYAKRVKIPAYRTDDLPLPEEDRQAQIPFDNQ